MTHTCSTCKTIMVYKALNTYKCLSCGRTKLTRINGLVPEMASRRIPK